MELIVEEISNEIKEINETIMNVHKSLDPRITNNIYYTRLKYLMFNEIVKFCRERIDLREDLLALRTTIGEFMTEDQIRETFDNLKQKYNSGDIENIGIEYHMESTRLDYGVVLFCALKRGDIFNLKKFVFRFRKGNLSSGVPGLDAIGMELPDVKKDIKEL